MCTNNKEYVESVRRKTVHIILIIALEIIEYFV